MVEAARESAQIASKTPCSYSAICRKLQLLTKNMSYVDNELLRIWQATNQTLISKIQVVNKSVKSLKKKLGGFIIAWIEE